MSEQKLLAIIGLGNPGAEHEGQRHNAGFWFADKFVAAHRGTFRREAKFSGELARVAISGQDVLVLKPGTFMNRSGQPVQALAQFYKLTPAQLLVVHDDLDLAAGDVRLKKAGGHGGHNGLRDIHQVIGAEYLRLRVGIGHPGEKELVLGYVLGRPSRADFDLINHSLDDAAAALPLWWTASWEKAVQALHSEKTPEKK